MQPFDVENTFEAVESLSTEEVRAIGERMREACDATSDDVSMKVHPERTVQLMSKQHNANNTLRRRPAVRTCLVIKAATSLACAIALADQQLSTCLLSFASAINPCGGFLEDKLGSQEESLARSTLLCKYLLDERCAPIYQANRQAQRGGSRTESSTAKTWMC